MNDEGVGVSCWLATASPFFKADESGIFSGWSAEAVDWAKLGPSGLFHIATMMNAKAIKPMKTSASSIRVNFLIFMVHTFVSNKRNDPPGILIYR